MRGSSHAASARLARQAAPARERTNLVFMGADAPDRPGRRANHFYALAREYAARWHRTIVDAPRHRTLAGIFASLREHPELRVGDLDIVTHANADDDLPFPLDERDADRRVTYPELAESLSAHAEAYRLPDSFLRRVEGLPVFSRHVRRIRVPGSVQHARGQTGRAEAYAWSPGRHAASGVLTEYRLCRDLPFRVSEEEGEDQRFFTTSFSEPGHPAR